MMKRFVVLQDESLVLSDSRTRKKWLRSRTSPRRLRQHLRQ